MNRDLEVASHLTEEVADLLIQPAIRSRMPAMVTTEDHAMVLVGRTERAGVRHYFVHDDQHGPYLGMRGLEAVSSASLRRQSGFNPAEGRHIPHETLSRESLDDFVESDRSRWNRAVQAVVLARPRGALLPTLHVLREASNWEKQISRAQSHPDFDSNPQIVPPAQSTRVTTLMGIDYKAQRNSQSTLLDRVAQTTFGSLHLAEWVTVVEGIADEVCVWELAIDASSGMVPRLQFARAGNVAIVPPIESSRDETAVVPVLFAIRQFAPLVAPSRVGKVSAMAENGVL